MGVSPQTSVPPEQRLASRSVAARVQCRLYGAGGSETAGCDIELRNVDSRGQASFYPSTSRAEHKASKQTGYWEAKQPSGGCDQKRKAHSWVARAEGGYCALHVNGQKKKRWGRASIG